MARLRLPLVPRTVRWGVVALVGATILYYSVFTPPGSGTFRTGPLGLFPFSDWLHFLAYGGLAATLAYALHDSPHPDWQVLLIVFCVTFTYGAAIEFIQLTLPGRTFDVGDMIVNAIGAAVAVGCWRLLVRYARFYRARQPTDLKAPIQ